MATTIVVIHGMWAGGWMWQPPRCSADPRRAKTVDASRIVCPVLVVAGGEDVLHPLSMMRAVARRYEPHSTYEELAGHGHWLVGELRRGFERIGVPVSVLFGDSSTGRPRSGAADPPGQTHLRLTGRSDAE